MHYIKRERNKSFSVTNEDKDLICTEFKTIEEAQDWIFLNFNELGVMLIEPDAESKTILEEANELIYGDRAQVYGPVTASFTRIARFWSVILDKEVTAEQVGLCMVALKMSRQLSKSGRDNLVDGAGYFGCIAKMDEEKV